MTTYPTGPTGAAGATTAGYTTVSEAAVRAFRMAQWEHNCTEDLDCCVLAGLTAAAPHIAAQALRQAAVDLATSTYHRECSIAVVRRLQQLADALAGPGPAETVRTTPAASGAINRPDMYFVGERGPEPIAVQPCANAAPHDRHIWGRPTLVACPGVDLEDGPQ